MLFGKQRENIETSEMRHRDTDTRRYGALEHLRIRNLWLHFNVLCPVSSLGSAFVLSNTGKVTKSSKLKLPLFFSVAVYVGFVVGHSDLVVSVQVLLLLLAQTHTHAHRQYISLF